MVLQMRAVHLLEGIGSPARRHCGSMLRLAEHALILLLGLLTTTCAEATSTSSPSYPVEAVLGGVCFGIVVICGIFFAAHRRHRREVVAEQKRKAGVRGTTIADIQASARDSRSTASNTAESFTSRPPPPDASSPAVPSGALAVTETDELALAESGGALSLPPKTAVAGPCAGTPPPGRRAAPSYQECLQRIRDADAARIPKAVGKGAEFVVGPPAASDGGKASFVPSDRAEETKEGYDGDDSCLVFDRGYVRRPGDAGADRDILKMGDVFGEAEADATVELVYDPGGVRIREMSPRRQQTPPR